MVTAFSGCGPIEDIAPRTGAANPEATTASPSAAKNIVLDMRDMIPSSCAASHSPRIKVFRNAQRRGKTECGGWDFPLRASRARLLNPWTPARPDLKSGAVVQAWLPPRPAHRAIGIMLLLRFSEVSFPQLSLRTGMRSRIIWLELSILLLALLFAEFGEVLREIRTDVVLDWFITLAPLIWIDVSIVVLYAFFRLYFTPELVPPRTSAAMKRVSAFLVPNTRVLRGGTRLRKVWAISAVVYAMTYAFLQGVFVVDLSGSLSPVFVVIESAIGYGPGIAWAPTTTFGIQLRPYSVAAAASLSLLSGLVFALAFQVLNTTGQRGARALPGPLLGFAVMCPACASGPVSGLFLAYVTPIAFMGEMGSASAFSRLLGASTLLLIVTLVLSWTMISFFTNVLLPDVPPTAIQGSASTHA